MKNFQIGDLVISSNNDIYLIYHEEKYLFYMFQISNMKFNFFDKLRFGEVNYLLSFKHLIKKE